MPRALITAIAAAALVLSACGGGSDHVRRTKHVRALPAATVQLADCNAWNVLRAPERRQLLAGMRGFFGGPVDHGNGNGEVLADAQATELLDSACKPRWAGRFKLYKIYGRAAAFTPPS